MAKSSANLVARCIDVRRHLEMKYKPQFKAWVADRDLVSLLYAFSQYICQYMWCPSISIYAQPKSVSRLRRIFVCPRGKAMHHRVRISSAVHSIGYDEFVFTNLKSLKILP